MTGRAKQSWQAWLYSFTSGLRQGRRTYDSERYYKVRCRLTREPGRIIELCLTPSEVRHMIPAMSAWLAAEPFNGSELPTETIRIRPIHTVECVITDATGGILLLHRSTEQRSQWELPGGNVSPIELARDSAKRHALTQIGLDVETGDAIGQCDFVDDGIPYVCHWYTARVIGGEESLRDAETYDGYGYFHLDRFATLRGQLSESTRQLADRLTLGDVRP